ncbi:MAG TPA: tetratricopeptide repeat protein, partial [Polyangia bacterium]
QDQATVDKLVQLNKRAMDDYDTADFDAAKKALLDAEKAGKRAGLETHPVMARTYIHLGAVYVLGFKDKNKAQHYFEKALDIQADIKLDRNMTSATVKDAFAAVVAKRDTTGGGDDSAPPAPSSGSKKNRRVDLDAVPPPTDSETESGSASKRRRGSDSSDDEPDLPSKIEALDCPYPNEAPPGKKLTLRCAAADNLGIANVNLYFKGFQMEDFESIAMEKSPKGWWQAVLPKKSVDGKSVQFYFEGVDASDQPVVSNGRAESPNVLVLVNKSAQKTKKRREEEDPLANTDTDFEGRKFGNRRFWIGVGVGTGLVLPFSGTPEALVNGYKDEGHAPAVPGIGWAGLLHVAPTIGIQFNPNIGLSIEGRDQWIRTPKGVSSTVAASGAHSVLVKLLFYTHQQRFRFFYGGGAGGGEGIREIVNVQQPGQSSFQDTVRIGPYLITAAGGMIFEFTKAVSGVLQLNAYVGFPKKGMSADGNLGIQFNFGDSSGRAEAAAKLRKESLSGSVEDEDEPK